MKKVFEFRFIQLLIERPHIDQHLFLHLFEPPVQGDNSAVLLVWLNTCHSLLKQTSHLLPCRFNQSFFFLSNTPGETHIPLLCFSTPPWSSLPCDTHKTMVERNYFLPCIWVLDSADFPIWASTPCRTDRERDMEKIQLAHTATSSNPVFFPALSASNGASISVHKTKVLTNGRP